MKAKARRRIPIATMPEPVLGQASLWRFHGYSPRRRIGQIRGERIRDIVAAEGTFACEHLVQHTAERPHVAALVGDAAFRLLGRHVGRRAEQHAGLCRRD